MTYLSATGIPELSLSMLYKLDACLLSLERQTRSPQQSHQTPNHQARCPPWLTTLWTSNMNWKHSISVNFYACSSCTQERTASSCWPGLAA